MSNEQDQKDFFGRREFIKGSALAGLTAPLFGNEALAAQQSLKAIGKARPVVISSANSNKGPDGSIFNGGLDCVSKAMEILKRGGDTLDAVVAGVNIVDISQTLMQDLFTMIMMVDIGRASISFDELQQRLASKGEELDRKSVV